MALLCLSFEMGCGVVSETHHVIRLAKRTTFHEPERFLYFQSDRLTQMHNEKLAARVWHKIKAQSKESDFSADYACGFVDGFSDYLYRGGTGEPPPLPPRDYWNIGRRPIVPQAAIHDWYDGFRHGSDECIRRGYRDAVVLPSSLLGIVDDGYVASRPAVLHDVPPSADETLPRPTQPVETLKVPAHDALPRRMELSEPNPLPRE